ncbi:glycosyl hydrolase [Microbacterium phosphatis]|uniref:glycosyl hydrolase n=1 Tax=Microbacterium phosphatis TaxID=3140248 RepID=UPI0031407EFB
MSIKTWFADNLNPKRWSVRARVIASLVAGVMVVGGGVGAAFALKPSEERPAASPMPAPSDTSSPTPTPTPTPTPELAEIPRTAVAVGAVNGWAVADRTQLAGVLPQVGDAADGRIALSVDAPIVPEPRPALSVTVAVQPSTEYTLSASLRLAAEELSAAHATLYVGARSLAIPDLNADWTKVDLPYETADAETSVEVKLVVDAPIRGLDIDAMSLVSDDGVNALPNPSFEDVTADWGIRNDVLILQQQTAALAVNLGEGAATWVATTLDGGEVARGTSELGAGLSAVPLDGLGQGYYNIEVTGADGRRVTAPVGLIEMETAHVPVDPRVGAHIHAAKDFNSDATIAAGALGMGLVRLGDKWETTEPSPGQYVFSSNFESAFGQADARGMQKLVISGRTNPLYDGNMPPRSPGGLDAYGRYAAALAQHFDVDAIEVYNEFNITWFSKGYCGGAAKCYAPILNAAHDAIKAVRPDLPVIGGVTGNFDAAWSNELWSNGGLDNLDVMSFHPYQVYFNPEGVAGVVRDAREGMTAFGAAKPIWLTELGWTTKTGDVSYADQANMVIRAEISALGRGVDRYVWYDLVNDENNRDAHEGNFGQFWQRWDGVAAFPPKPAAFTQALMLTHLAGKPIKAVEDVGVPGASSYAFGAAGGETVRFAWLPSGEGVAEYAADGPITVTTAAGPASTVAPEDGKVRIKLTSRPVILSGDFAD